MYNSEIHFGHKSFGIYKKFEVQWYLFFIMFFFQHFKISRHHQSANLLSLNMKAKLIQNSSVQCGKKLEQSIHYFGAK